LRLLPKHVTIYNKHLLPHSQNTYHKVSMGIAPYDYFFKYVEANKKGGQQS